MKLFAIAIWGSFGVAALAVGCSVKATGGVDIGGHGGTDAGTVKKDGATQTDAPAAVSNICKPDLTGFTDPPYHPAARTAGACTTEQLGTAYDACWGSTSTQDACNKWMAANDVCNPCLGGADTEASWGPFSYNDAGDEATNTAGCLELKGIAASCAGSYAVADACQEFACKPCYADGHLASSDEGETMSDKEWSNYDACWKSAETSACAAKWSASDQCLGLKDPNDTTPELDACTFPNTNDEKVYKEFFVKFTGVFCAK